MYTIAVAAHYETNKIKAYEMDWQEFCEQVIGKSVPITEASKKECPLFMPGKPIPGKTKGDDAVDEMHFGVLDFDSVTEEQTETIMTALEGYKYAVYSSYSHGNRHEVDGSYSFRVVMPLSRPIKRADWDPFWERFIGFFPGVEPDLSCRDEGRLYALPNSNKEGFADYSLEGKDLDVDQVLALPVQIKSKANREGPKAELDHVDPRQVKRFAKQLVNNPKPEKAHIGQLLLDVCEGKPYSKTQGTRHQSMLAATMALERKFPTTSVDALADLFTNSLTAIAKADPEFDPEQRYQDVLKALDGARAKRLEYLDQKQEEEKKETAQLIAIARPDGKTAEYDETDIEALAKIADCPAGQIDRRWVVSCASGYYFLTLGGYRGPYTLKDAPLAARDFLSPAPISLKAANERGEWNQRPFQQLLLDYGTAFEKVVADMCVDVSRVIGNTLHEKVCQLRHLKPEYNDQINDYLLLLGASNPDKFLDWLATVTDLSRQTCAIYLKGVKGAGKSLFPTLLARLYTTGGYTPIENILGEFTADMANCPIIGVDENIAKRSNASSAQIRSLIGSSNRPLRRMYQGSVPMLGAIRLVIAANNDNILNFEHEEHSKEDIDAIAERFLYLYAPEEAAEWFRTERPDVTNEWIKKDAFAKHILWLRDNRKVETGSRWLVSGELSQMTRKLAVRGHIRDGVCEFLAKYLCDTKILDQKKTGLVFIEDKKLWINTYAILEHADLYLREGVAEKWTAKKVSTAIAGLALAEKRTIMKGRKVRFHQINMDYVLSYMDEVGVGDVDYVRTLLNQGGNK